MGDQFWPRALAAKRAWVLVNPDAVHTYHYIPDVAAGLMTLGCADSDIYGRPWMLPCTRPGTMRELVARFSRKLARFTLGLRTHGTCEARLFSLKSEFRLQPESKPRVRRKIRLSSVPRWMVHASGIFITLLREVDEMMYQWDEPFVINDRRFRERFQQEPNDVDEAAAATVAWAQQHYTSSKQLGRRGV